MRGRGWKFLALVGLLTVSSLGAAAPAEPEDELFSRLEGRWGGNGAVMGMESEAVMTWTLELGGRFARLEFENAMTPPEGEPRTFAGHGYYALGDARGSGSGRWFDSRGLQLPLVFERSGDSLVVDWGSPETESGRTTYELRADGVLEVVDEVLRDGELAEFGRIRYRSDG